MSFHKILVAIDNSSLSSPVFTAALELAQSNQATLKLLHCIIPETIGPSTAPTVLDVSMPSMMLGNDYQTQQIVIEQRIEEGQALLKHYAQEAMNRGILTQSEYQVGDAGHQLCAVAQDWDADLVVVGRRGRSGLAEAFLGSVSNYVVHHAHCSVLVIQDVKSEPLADAVTEMPLEAIAPLSSQPAI